MPELRLPFFAHGGDYNPDQWRHIPGTLEEDVRLMKLAHCNLMSVGIFSWAALEPREGEYDFDWLERVLDTLYANGIHVFLATPSGARPAWMSQKYPEVLRVSDQGIRNLHGERHNHCFTSPVYRAFVHKINAALAERFGKHPAVVGWHVSNEYSGECHCELCQEAFRRWLMKKYGTLNALNQAYWTGFWAKTYTDWSQLHSPSARGEGSIHGLYLDWMRFVTDQTIDFMRHEVEAVRAFSDLPVTTNLMGSFYGLDSFRFARVLDFASYDSYPSWGETSDYSIALGAGFQYDITRSILNKPWILMESTPSMVNWKEICQPKRPGMHLASSLLTVAHGSDSVMYFQWRKSRGAAEKFHGAVVGHERSEHTRVFRDVTEVGECLERILPVLHARTEARAALMFDWNNRWAIANANGPRKDKQHDEIVQEHYAALAGAHVNIDIVDEEKPLQGYSLVSAPMLYMVKPGLAERLRAFVEKGGTLVLTYFSGYVDENDLCFLDGMPGPLRPLAGVWAEEIDALYPGQSNKIVMRPGNALGLEGEFACGFLCELAHAEGAQALADYGEDFYAGMPAVTENRLGKGRVIYLAARAEQKFLDLLYARLLRDAGVAPIVDAPAGVIVKEREKDGKKYTFLLNFAGQDVRMTVPEGLDLVSGARVRGETALKNRQVMIVER